MRGPDTSHARAIPRNAKEVGLKGPGLLSACAPRRSAEVRCGDCGGACPLGLGVRKVHLTLSQRCGLNTQFEANVRAIVKARSSVQPAISGAIKKAPVNEGMTGDWKHQRALLIMRASDSCEFW